MNNKPEDKKSDQLPGVVVHDGEPIGYAAPDCLDLKAISVFKLRGDCFNVPLYLHPAPSQLDSFEAVYCQLKGCEPHGLASCDDFKDWKASLSAPSQSSESVAWKCFHCGEAFTDEAHAALHFGTKQQHYPVCTVSAERLRELEAILQSYQEEDTDLHRAMYKMKLGHAIALQREEEKGYARGLKDAAKEREDVISMLLDVARAAEQAMENSEENTAGLHWNKANFDILSAAVDQLDTLPDDKPGYTLGAAAKASWALNKYRTPPSQPSAEALVQAQPPCDNAHVKEGCEQFTHWTVTAPSGLQWTGESLMESFRNARSATVDPVAAHERLMKAIEEDRQEERKEMEALVQAALEAATKVVWGNAEITGQQAQSLMKDIRALSPQQIIESCKEKS